VVQTLLQNLLSVPRDSSLLETSRCGRPTLSPARQGLEATGSHSDFREGHQAACPLCSCRSSTSPAVLPWAPGQGRLCYAHINM
jgi:hypothetical protein